MEQQLEEISRANLTRFWAKIHKHKIVRPAIDAQVALDALNLYHCVRQSNIIQVLNDGKILPKNRITYAEMTNNDRDYVQGFDQHISMSFGEPWTEYGPYAFAFGLQHISDDALIFLADPWMFGNKQLQDNFLTKTDYIVLMRELIIRNLIFIGKNSFMKLPWTPDAHWLIKRNCRHFELKQPETLDWHEADEFFVWNHFEAGLHGAMRLLWSKQGLVLYVGLWLITFIPAIMLGI